ncbi:MAG TPA: ribonuclease P protein component [Verrucomicrobia bacterium]|nr:ribonuclease P protein component [Verrucomicrobiota bacterium]HOB34025.1 ribonuclease P protein component [Verrucomicrobiota bacterium]HOP97678.1 ribonuclease P protein component [Verrucomicrobiota bacterium]HPU56049.1 ribonuclease P protein component [Verrucomicrobiota bacterium]
MAEEPTTRLRFRRNARIRLGKDFSRIRQKGERLVAGCIIANWIPLPAGSHSRLGVVTSSKIGNATVRARARRLLRETFRVHQHDFVRPLDLVLVARPSIAGRKMQDVERDFLTLCKKAGLLKKTESRSCG